MPNSAQSVSMTLNSSQLEQWFATIERDNAPNTSETNPHLATQFLARFGLREAKQVVEFLKTTGGNETINMIAQELMKEEAKAQLIRESTADEMLRQQRLLFLLMTLISKNKAHVEHVNEMTQEQIDKQLKETKAEAKKNSLIEMHIADANMRANEILKLDKELKKLESELTNLEQELQELEEEWLEIEEINADISDYLEELNEFLQIPLLIDQPIAEYITHANKQVTSLSAELETLRALQTAQAPTASNVDRVQETTVHRLDKRMQHLEKRLALFQSQLEQPPQTREELYQQLIDRVKARLNEQVASNEEIQLPTHRAGQIEGLRLQERGFSQALQFIRKEKILLNSQLEPVNDFSQAQFIIDPSQKARYRRYGDSYAVFSENMDPDHASEKDLLQAKLNYEKLKPDICTVTFFHNNRKQNQTEMFRTRSQNCQSRLQDLMSRIDSHQEFNPAAMVNIRKVPQKRLKNIISIIAAFPFY
ncbi:hypothetical protein DGG96_17135 [Legionella qingyii]|uniref:LidA long coiled-coil domain-containing protein n=1 Tax=Legionella qingyii TaxID=2184757 RepID=A0A317U269_9GAMM|nr:hypothetical protein [Legionella qingyii]PWY54400.1 hypothetical protein DGG96_17135 [Legionella qingyii]